MVARPIDAAEGYRLFRQTGGATQLDEINEHLRGVGLREVSPRMYVHYQRLHRHDYYSYIPINRLDIALAGEDAWSEELQARYPEIAQPVHAEVIWAAKVRDASVASLGPSTATVQGDEVPPAGVPVVLRLLATGIERAGTVVRSDSASGLFHVAFDPYTSVTLSPEDSPTTATVRVDLPAAAKNLSAVGDVLLSLDRFLVRADSNRDSLTRVRQVTLNSPLDIVIAGNEALTQILALLTASVALRQLWYRGTKAKYEAEGIKLDNERRRANAQAEADAELKEAIRHEVDADHAPILVGLAQPDLPAGEPGSEDRLRLADAAQAALDLPVATEVAKE